MDPKVADAEPAPVVLGRAQPEAAVEDEDEDEDKTSFLPMTAPAAFAPRLAAAPKLSVIIAADDGDDDEDKTSFLPVGGPPPGPAPAPAPPALPTPAAMVAASADDGGDDEDKTSFLPVGGAPGPIPVPTPPAPPAPPKPAVLAATIVDDGDGDDDGDKTSFLPVGGAPGPIPVPPMPPAPPAPPGPPTAAVILAASADDGDDDGDKTSFLPVAGGPAPATPTATLRDAGTVVEAVPLPPPPPPEDDDGDKTIMFAGESAPPAQVTTRPPASSPQLAPAAPAPPAAPAAPSVHLARPQPLATPPPAPSREDQTIMFAGNDGPPQRPVAAIAPVTPSVTTQPAPQRAAPQRPGSAGAASPARPALAPTPTPAPASPAQTTTNTVSGTTGATGGTSTTGGTGGTGGTGATRRATGTGHSISAWSPGGSTNAGTDGAGSSPATGGGPVGSPQEGAVIAQYELIRKLGEGGMGTVFLARDVRLGRRVAIKFLHATSPELTERFVIEARATARVEHENIVSIYEVGEWGGSPYMVLQFLQGQELTKVIPRGKPMPVPRVTEIMTPVLRALDYAHAQGIVHRDLKPDNIFITDGGVTKVLDFGIAKVVQGEDKTSDGEGTLAPGELAAGGNTSLTRHGSIMGTMPYMSPEQWGNGVAIDHTTDIWAVGIMMYRMLSGKHPLHPLKGTELMVTGFVDEPMPSLREHAPDLPEELIKVIDKALAKVKSERWPNALALLRALEPFQPGRYTVGQAVSHEESPYAGLSAFQEQDANRFFGRSREIAAMSQRLREVPLMAVVGSSGVGKSSFVRAGVVPALKNSGEAWEISVVRPGRAPLMALAGLITQLTQDTTSATSLNLGDEVDQQKQRADRLRKEPGYFGTVLRRHARRDKKKLLIFVDQFEELYTLVEDLEERMAFTACLSAAADDPTSPMRVVVSIRSDFLDRCVEDVHFMNELSQGLFFMTAPTRDGMRDSLVLPAEMAGYKFESEAIVDDMLEHLAHTNGALPLLQFTADKLWSERDPSRKQLTQAAYKALGGVSGALAAHAGQVLAQVSGDQLKVARALFLRLVTPERTRAIVAMEDLREQLGDATEVQRIIDQLVHARLLVVQGGGGGGGATVEIVHESLIHGWPQLRRWLDEGQDDAAFLEQLRAAARQWDGKKGDSGLLWRGEMAEEAKRFVRRFQGTLPEVQQRFLKAVINLSMRAARIRKTLLIVGAVVVSVLLAAAAVALYIINDSRQETERQAVAARQAEVRATDAAAEAESRKIEAEQRKAEAEKALAEVQAAERDKEAAREAERKALKEANESRESLAKALVDAQAAEKRATDAAKEASSARQVAEERAREAIAARLAATAANTNLQVALKEVEQRRRAAELAKEEALRRLKEQTRGGVVEVLR